MDPTADKTRQGSRPYSLNSFLSYKYLNIQTA